MRYIILSTILALGVGCASAQQKFESKANYRQAQIEAIKVQKQADTVAAQASSAERVAMWNALSEAVKANPEAASHMAIVAAVASTSKDGNTVTRSNVVSLNKERDDAQAIDYLKVLTPGLIGGVTQAGIAAIAAETTRESIKANRDVRIVEAEMDGKMWDVLSTGMIEAGDNNETLIIDADGYSGQAADSTVDELFPVDEEEDGVPGPDQDTVVVDDDTDTTDTTDDTDTTDTTDDTDDTDDTVVDCTKPQFSPVPPECES